MPDKKLTEIEQEFFSDIQSEYLKEGNLPLDFSDADIEKEADALLEAGDIDMDAGKVKVATYTLFSNKFFQKGFEDGLRDASVDWFPVAMGMSFGLG